MTTISMGSNWTVYCLVFTEMEGQRTDRQLINSFDLFHSPNFRLFFRFSFNLEGRVSRLLTVNIAGAVFI